MTDNYRDPKANAAARAFRARAKTLEVELVNAFGELKRQHPRALQPLLDHLGVASWSDVPITDRQNVIALIERKLIEWKDR